MKSMLVFRKTLTMTAFILLLAVFFATLEGTFFCADDSIDVCAGSECCLQCHNLHTSNLVSRVSTLETVFGDYSVFKITYSFFCKDPVLGRIYRPPILNFSV